MHSYTYFLNWSIISVLEQQWSYISYIKDSEPKRILRQTQSSPLQQARARALEFSTDGEIQYWGATLIAAK